MWGQFGNQPFSGFGTGSQRDVEALNKALTAGYGMINQTNGDAMRVQSLEGSLKTLTYTSKHIQMFRKIPKSPAFSTVEEYNTVLSYGGNAGGFLRETELAPTQDSSYARRMALVKYLGVTREISQVATMVSSAHGDLVTLSNHDGIMWLLKVIEDALFHGDSSLAFSGESEQWDGLDAYIDAASYIDLENTPLTETDLEDASNMIAENYGMATDLFWGYKPGSDFMKIFYPRERVNLPAPSNGKAGTVVNSFVSQWGEIEFNPNIFLRRLPNPPAAPTSANAPSTPTGITATGYLAASTGEWSKLLGTVTANVAFSYVATACNRFGESAPTAILPTNVATADVNTNAAKTLTVTNAAVLGPNPPEYVKIYRSKPGIVGTAMTDFSHILSIPVSTQAASGTTLVTDRNFLIPFTHIAYLGTMDPSVITFRQLCPLMKLDLATMGPAFRWMLMLWGTPIVFAPRKWARIVNIGEIGS